MVFSRQIERCTRCGGQLKIIASRIARDRAAGRAEYEDTGSDWKAMSPKLRQAIDAYNREPPQVQAEILERFSRTPALEKSLGEDLNRRRAYVREQGCDRGADLGM
jgi:hypothetical protein